MNALRTVFQMNPILKRRFMIAMLLFGVQVARAQEMQVPADSAGNIEFINARLEKKLGMFTSYTGFIEARLFLGSDSAYILEVSYQTEGRFYRKRQVLTAAEAITFRKDVTARLNMQAPEFMLNQTGRTLLLATSSAVSLGYYGWALPTALNVYDEKTFLGLYMLTSGAGFFGPYMLTKN